MKRGARFLILDQDAPENSDADYIVLDVPPSQLRPLIRQLEDRAALAEKAETRAVLRGQKGEVWCVHLLVEASHPKTAKQDGTVTYPPSLLKDSIPRAGRS
jgi:hypothetical protein